VPFYAKLTVIFGVAAGVTQATAEDDLVQALFVVSMSAGAGSVGLALDGATRGVMVGVLCCATAMFAFFRVPVYFF
jgi:hypothetical protein